MNTRKTLATLSLSVIFSCAAEPGTPVAPATTRCPEQSGTIEVGKLGDPELTEASGLAVSLAQDDLLWSNNDSGDEARLFAIGKNGRKRGQVHLDGVTAADIEDIALGKESDAKYYLYTADIGDNLLIRSQYAIYRIPEPTVPAGSFDAHVPAETMLFTYGDKARHDAETLLFDPRSGELFVVTKHKDGGRLFRLGKFTAGTVIAEDQGGVPVDTATGGSISPDGKNVVVRDYGGVAKLWPIVGAATLQSTFKSTACSVALGLDLQGEAICFDTDSRTIYTTSEGKNAPLHRTDPVK